MFYIVIEEYNLCILFDIFFHVLKIESLQILICTL